MSAMMRGNLRMALSGVRGAKWRSILTMTGVIVGVAAVVTVVGIGEGVKRQVARQLDGFGKELITVRPGVVPAHAPLTADSGTDAVFGMGAAGGLSTHDVKAVQEAEHVTLAAPLGLVAGAVEVDGRSFTSAPVIATGSALPEALNQKIAFGEFWSEEFETGHTAVLGSRVSTELFDESVPLGRSFVFRGETFVVRGVFEEFANVPFSPTASFDHAIFIPYKVAAELTRTDGQLYAILAKPDSAGNVTAAVAAITAKVKHEHGGTQDFSVLKPEQSIAQGSGIVRLLTTWICAVAVISLFIGGVGIMNIMLLTVTERMHEIGVRKAVGATSRQIFGQFALEATVLSVLGGLIGIVLSFGVYGLLYAYTDLKPVISWQAPAIAAGVSIAIGIIFGTAPAIKAARKDPIEALRHE